MVWKYAKIVYTQITRNTQEPRIMIKIFFHSESSSLYCRMEICWLRWYTPGILRGLEWIRFLFRYRMSDLSPNRLGRLTHRYRWSVRTQRFVFLSDHFYPQKSATEAPSQKDHFQGSNSFPYCLYLRFQILSLSYHETSFSSILKVNIAKFVFEQITFPSFSSFYLTFPSSSFIIFL